MYLHPDDPSGLVPAERDACAIICYLNKEGRPTHGNVQRTIEALVKMGHRAGELGGEGDGCGLLTDIPRQLWREVLSGAGHSPELAASPGFALGHLLVPREALDSRPGAAGKDPEAFPGRRGPRPGAAPGAGAQRSPLLLGAPFRAALLAAGPAFRQARQGSRPSLSAAPGDRDRNRRPRRLPLHPGRLLQDPGRSGNAQPLLSGTQAPRLSLGGDHRPQPLLHQHPAHGHARPALQPARPQRRDQHHCPGAGGGAHARDPPAARRQRLAGPQPHPGGADPPARPEPVRGDGHPLPPIVSEMEKMPAERQAGLCLFPAPLSRQRPGSGGDHRAPPGPLRLLRRCHGAAPPVVRRDGEGIFRLLRGGGRPARGDRHRSPSAGARGEDRRCACFPGAGCASWSRKSCGGRSVPCSAAAPIRTPRAKPYSGADSATVRPVAGEGLRPRRRAGAGEPPVRPGLEEQRPAQPARDGAQRRRPHRLPRLRRTPGRPGGGAAEPLGLLQGAGGGGHQPGHRPGARVGTLLHPGLPRPAAEAARRRP